MLEFVTGRVVSADAGSVVVDAGGLGLRLRVHDGARFRRLVGRRVTLPAWIDLHPRRVVLFGFPDAAERTRFAALVGIPGVGAVTALKLLPAWDALTRPRGGAVPDLPGVGPATRAKIARWLARDGRPAAATAEARDVASALAGLGLPAAEARDRAARVVARHPDAPLDELVRRAVSGSVRRR